MSTLAVREVTQAVISNEIVNQFTKFLDVRPLTIRSYSSGLKMFAKYLYSTKIENPTRDNILAFKKELEALGRKPSTIALYIAALRRFFSWTEQAGFYPNIAVGIKSPKLSKGHKKDCFSAPQIKSILKGIDRSNREGMRNYAIMALMATGGLRTIEISRAKIEDLRTVGGVPVLYIQGKGRTERTEFVKITSQVEEAIRQYLKMRGKVDATEALFASESKRNKGECLTTRSISGICKSAMNLAGFNSKQLTAHSLRHTAVTLALMNGQSLEEVQHFARHLSVNTTLIYSHAVNRMKSQCENVIANLIF